MAKKTNQTLKVSSKNCSTTHPAKSTGRVCTAYVDVKGRSSASGVVAYTKNSRFKDSDVQAVVQRVLKKS